MTLPFRLRAVALHLIASALVAPLAAAIVILVWRPSPHSTLAMGTSLFLLIVVLQLAAFGYRLHMMAMAFEIDTIA